MLDRFLSRAWKGAFEAAGLVSMIFLVMGLSLDRIYPNLEPQTRAILFGFLPILLVIQVPRATRTCISVAKPVATSQSLGHTDVLTTLRSYGQISRERQRTLITGESEDDLLED